MTPDDVRRYREAIEGVLEYAYTGDMAQPLRDDVARLEELSRELASLHPPATPGRVSEGAALAAYKRAFNAIDDRCEFHPLLRKDFARIAAKLTAELDQAIASSAGTGG